MAQRILRPLSYGDLFDELFDLYKRRFVLEPLYEIAPYVIHPFYGISIKGLLDRLEDNKDVIKLDPDF